MSALRKEIAEIIYEGNWEIRGNLNERTKDITDHYLADEEEVIDKIIDTVKDTERWPHFLEEK